MPESAELPLRDIHVPEPVSWWPPAPGWWLLAIVLVLTVAALWWWQSRRRRLRLAAVTVARQELDAIERDFQAGSDAVATLRRLSTLMRRLSISLYSRGQSAGLTGEAWLAFLDGPLQRPAFSAGPGRVLQEGPYRRSVTRGEVEPLLALCREWIDTAGRSQGPG